MSSKLRPASSGHELARELIAKHGKDRYPTAERNALKCAGELGELIEAILKHADAHIHRLDQERYHQCPAIAKEYADTGLALYALGDKLGLDLIAVMAEVVEHETRRF